MMEKLDLRSFMLLVGVVLMTGHAGSLR